MAEDCCDKDLLLTPEQHKKIRNILLMVFVINLGMFFLEVGSGFIARSSTLIADSLDMLADAFVYGLSLYVLKENHIIKARASLVKGILMFLLGAYVVSEGVYKILYPILPSGETISLIGVIALIANLTCFALLWKHKNDDLNLKSAWICSRNDVTTNVVVILAGFLVLYFQSMWPDIIVGLGMTLIVFNSSAQIIKEALHQSHLIGH